MPAAERHPEVVEALRKAIDTVDLDGVLYRLMEIAYKKRNEQDHKAGNRAEHDYWHAAGGTLSRTLDEIGEI